LAGALVSDAQAKEAFECLAFTHRKEYARWEAEANREETRLRRVQQLRGGKTRH
jgi:uncharacterized protein YdeI (YjbR/CyaY-like superfamily)